MSTPSLSSPLLTFLSQTRSAALRLVRQDLSTCTLVLGNPSCDLDSFISAVLYSYFYSSRSQRSRKKNDDKKSGGGKRMYIPLLNLSTVSSSELWRLRPEFGCALGLAIGGGSGSSRDKERKLLENLITIADIRSAPSSSLSSLLLSKSTSGVHDDVSGEPEKVGLVLVDHNALAIPGVDIDVFSSHTQITGCIDHHDDESTVPSAAYPRVIKTGIGSCASLVIQHLRKDELWPPTIQDDDADPTATTEQTELAKLALAPILIDTANLTAEGKVTDTDREAVNFLETCIRGSSKEARGSVEARPPWDRDVFYEKISDTKSNSLELLNLDEIFERDYKEWTETTTSGHDLNIGIASVVKPLSWLLEKAADLPAPSSENKSSSSTRLLAEIERYARLQTEQNLSLFAIMTTSNSPQGDFQRELMVIAYGSEATKALQRFESGTAEKLKLQPWHESEELFASVVEGEETSVAEEAEGGEDGKRMGRMWWQRNLAQSRKQVAPLLREAVKSGS